MKNLFSGSPTVGSHDTPLMENDLFDRVQSLEQRVQFLEQRLSTEDRPQNEKPQRKKITWGDLKKFFKYVVTPITNLMNSVASLYRAVSPKKSKTAFA